MTGKVSCTPWSQKRQTWSTLFYSSGSAEVVGKGIERGALVAGHKRLRSPDDGGSELQHLVPVTTNLVYSTLLSMECGSSAEVVGKVDD
ncbi:hypothetical protein CDAR_370631 [Caerostris darwini]|uniref:Uncharacterized protein n=1 Tax=Caerostris darwini TaxID=1538125 RepID=A0AAV4VI21_9ARAC|nr:hypothetical protein CDAR_370631 [Caerostris darwini]